MPDRPSIAGRRRLLSASLAFVATTWIGAARSAEGDAEFRTIVWDDLIPADWDPFKHFNVSRIGALMDGSPEAAKMMRALRESWDNAPVRPELGGQRVRLPGYVVPLDEVKGGLKEFLLVPYFGACIHVPPPPANQIVHAISATPLKLRTMDAIWASGTLSTGRSDSTMGTSGYRMQVRAVEPYTAPPGK